MFRQARPSPDRSCRPRRDGRLGNRRIARNETGRAAAPPSHDHAFAWFGLLTAQVGYSVDNALFYVKGGAAVTHDRFDVLFSPDTTAGETDDQTRWGGALGAGLEYGFAPNWSLAIEYDHLFMPDKTTTFTVVGARGGPLQHRAHRSGCRSRWFAPELPLRWLTGVMVAAAFGVVSRRSQGWRARSPRRRCAGPAAA
ncbi:MAG: porin family protein [Mesorhizobium sp.]|nr:MAG: porin family protein [Mesorhizobium sp.]RWH30987.1 MAG: porin family protein [Mesorhizobium sp.]RWH39031.1 MAG: porin family protein [Mesorhizobium sp.]RWH45564.1 MAG: porin family protein [Mesorhizobium sp.]RWI21977.1 MAG: porin family protein [Mesorhizobium sp.]